jgi:hypothetical protein
MSEPCQHGLQEAEDAWVILGRQVITQAHRQGTRQSAALQAIDTEVEQID